MFLDSVQQSLASAANVPAVTAAHARIYDIASFKETLFMISTATLKATFIANSQYSAWPPKRIYLRSAICSIALGFRTIAKRYCFNTRAGYK